MSALAGVQITKARPDAKKLGEASLSDRPIYRRERNPGGVGGGISAPSPQPEGKGAQELKETARLLDKIRKTILPYLVSEGTKDKPWHWHQRWTVTRLLIVGEELGYEAYPEYPCFNPEARSRQGRIDVAWGEMAKGHFIPRVLIEICKGMPRRRDIGKLSSLSNKALCVAVSLSPSRKAQAWEIREQRAKSLRKHYEGLNIGEIWFLHYQQKPQLLSEWLGILVNKSIEGDWPAVELYCEKCGCKMKHTIYETIPHSFARWQCSVCGLIRSGPHPSRGWVQKQLKRQRDEKQGKMF